MLNFLFGDADPGVFDFNHRFFIAFIPAQRDVSLLRKLYAVFVMLTRIWISLS